jgi:iron complex transport system substrate-binding protein
LLDDSRQGVDVHAFNQRTIAEILDMIRTLGALVNALDRAKRLTDDLVAAITNARGRASQRPFRPKVYFEEWDDPMISGIAWVSELIEIAGGIDVFADLAHYKSAKDRVVTSDQIIARVPDIIIGSWCGKKFRPDKVVNRAGFDTLPAVRQGAVYEIKSPLILQPGPAALTDRLAAMEAIIANSVAAYDRQTV